MFFRKNMRFIAKKEDDMKMQFLVMLLCLGASSCAPFREKEIVGDWQATAVLENGMPMDVETQVISFRFHANDYYEFNGTLNYREAGTYYIDSKYLFTTDTINQATVEKAVEIVKLTADSLFIKMNDNGRELLMKLSKK